MISWSYCRMKSKAIEFIADDFQLLQIWKHDFNARGWFEVPTKNFHDISSFFINLSISSLFSLFHAVFVFFFSLLLFLDDAFNHDSFIGCLEGIEASVVRDREKVFNCQESISIVEENLIFATEVLIWVLISTFWSGSGFETGVLAGYSPKQQDLVESGNNFSVNSSVNPVSPIIWGFCVQIIFVLK